MKYRTPKTFIISLLLLLFLVQGGIGYWVLQHKIWLVKKEMKALVMGSVAEDQLTPIHLTEVEFNQLEWPEPWEFLYKGQMYDISRKEFHKDGSVTLYAVMDTEENELKAMVRSLVKNSSDKKQTQEHLNFFYKFQSQWTCDFEPFEIPFLESRTVHFASNRFFISSPHVRLNELPPNCSSGILLASFLKNHACVFPPESSFTSFKELSD